jgi:hypothetical protein
MLENWQLTVSVALCAFSLWVLVRRDWVRLTRPSRSVQARVTGHRESHSGGDQTWAAIYSFEDGHGHREVIDEVYQSAPQPPLGAAIMLVYPEGRPDLARKPRLFLWLGVYSVIVGLLALLLAKAFGLIGS